MPTRGWRRGSPATAGLRFDPTPSAAPALAGRTRRLPRLPPPREKAVARQHKRAQAGPGGVHVRRARAAPGARLDCCRSGSSDRAGARRQLSRGVRARTWPAARLDGLVAELERALARSGRPLPPARRSRSSSAVFARRPRRPRTCARCGSRATAAARRRRLRQPGERFAAGSPTGSAWLDACARCGRFRRDGRIGPEERLLGLPRLRAWTTSTSSIDAAASCSSRVITTGDDPAVARARPGAGQDLDPRGPRPRLVPRPALRAGGRRVPGGDRPGADKRLRALLPRPLAAAARPARRSAPAARPRRVAATQAPGLPRLPRPGTSASVGDARILAASDR